MTITEGIVKKTREAKTNKHGLYLCRILCYETFRALIPSRSKTRTKVYIHVWFYFLFSLLYLSHTSETNSSRTIHAVREQKHRILLKQRSWRLPTSREGFVRSVRQGLVPVGSFRVPPGRSSKNCPIVVP